MLKRLLFVASLSVIAIGPAATTAAAEVNKIMHFVGGHMRPEFLLNFEPPAKWHEDAAATAKNGVKIYVPDGSNFGSAPALMYIRVTYNSDHRSLEKFIEVAHERWRADEQRATIDKLASETRLSDRSEFRVYHFYNPNKPQQAYELMAYGEDSDKDGNDYCLMIGLSAASQAAIDKAEPAFRAALKSH